MNFVALGVNHKTASLALRERLALTPERSEANLRLLIGQSHIDEAIILSTCNRTEIYCVTHDQAQLRNWIKHYGGLASNQMDSSIYIHQGEEAVQHLIRVASGLDSMVIGEPQILGQVKQAYSLAETVGGVGKYLHNLFQYVFSATKQIRSETLIGNNSLSVAYFAVQVATRVFTDLKDTHALLVGSGQTIKLIADYLQDYNIGSMTIAGRDLARTQTLANLYDAESILISTLPEHLPKADIVISATSHPLPILGKGLVETALKQRKKRMMVMLDLAMPRDIEPEVENLKDVYLYNLEHLQTMVEKSLHSRKDAANQAETMINEHVRQFNRIEKIREHGPLIGDFRQKFEDISNETLQVALNKLKNGYEAEDVLYLLANQLTNKFLHEPSLFLRQASLSDDLVSLETIKKLYGLLDRDK